MAISAWTVALSPELLPGPELVQGVLGLIQQHRQSKHVCQQSVNLIKPCKEIFCVMGLHALEICNRIKCFINQSCVVKGQYVPYECEVPLIPFQNDEPDAPHTLDASAQPYISLYRTHIEAPILKSTKAYCARLRGEWLTQGVASYLSRVQAVLKDEKERPRL